MSWGVATFVYINLNFTLEKQEDDVCSDRSNRKPWSPQRTFEELNALETRRGEEGRGTRGVAESRPTLFLESRIDTFLATQNVSICWGWGGDTDYFWHNPKGKVGALEQSNNSFWLQTDLRLTHCRSFDGRDTFGDNGTSLFLHWFSSAPRGEERGQCLGHTTG